MTNVVDAGFREVADRVWVARHREFDLNITLVGGSAGLLVVDTHASTEAARGVIEAVRRLGAGEVVAVTNTHWHFDHTFGNGAFRAAYGDVPIHAHEDARDELATAGPALVADVADTELVLPDHTFSSAKVLDLGDRVVELIHPGRAHTAGDLVVRVPDVDVLVTGDVVEESAPPSFGPDSFPLDWPHSLDIVLGLATESTVVVPGHGGLVDREFVEIQRNTIGLVASTIRDLVARGVPLAQALDVGDWALPTDVLGDAVRRGYEQLPLGRTQLPLA
ncbi:MBL fold metallo-hydrolase [Nocardioides sp.]|uniref:MBL fold metallo-hydrolase n=1 Tax=Nocardioides sp. TaxID=35761 RepID=UPI0035681AA7